MQKSIWTKISFIFVFFPVYSFATFHYRPEYAQMSSLAYSQSLGFSSLILSYEGSSIMQGPSMLYRGGNSSFNVGYGNTSDNTHTMDVSYVSPLLGDDSNMVFGLEYLVNFIPMGTNINNNYFQGKTNELGYEQVLTGAFAYDFDDMGTIGVNMKLPFDSYKKGTLDAGVLFDITYNISFFGIDILAGIANIGGTYTDGHFLGVYPDLELGIGYNYIDGKGEQVFGLGFTLENNLGELIGNSFLFGLGGRIRLFSTGSSNSKPLIHDNILEHRDNRKARNITPEAFFSSLAANLYLNVAFQFSASHTYAHSSNDTTHFSLGLTSMINSFTLDLGVIFPDSKNKRFGTYVSIGSIF